MKYFCCSISKDNSNTTWNKNIKHYNPLLNLENELQMGQLKLTSFSISKNKPTLLHDLNKILIIGYVLLNGKCISNCSKSDELKFFYEYLSSLISKKHFTPLNELGGSFLIIFQLGNKFIFISDNISSKKLYYSINNNEILMSDDLRLLLCNDKVPFEINEKKCRLFCSCLYTEHEIEDTDETFYKYIYKIKSGSILIFENYDFCKEISYFSEYNVNSIAYSIENPMCFFRRNLNNINDSIIKNECSSSIGVSLSGGIDSSVILASLIDLGYREKIYAYHVSFRNTNLHQCSDNEIVKNLIKDTGIKGKILYADNSLRFKNSNIGSDKISFIDGPALMGNELSYDMFSPILKSDGVNNLFTGDGGDYLFMGTKYCGDYYIRNQQYKEAIRRARRLSKSDKPLDQIKSNIIYNVIPLLPLVSNYMYKHIFWDENKRINTPDYMHKELIEISKNFSFKLKSEGKHINNWYRRFIFDFMFPKAPYVDVNIDSFSFKLPLEDNLMLRTVLAIPPNYHYDIYRGWQGQYLTRKMILRKSYSDILPQYITKQKNKTIYGNMYRHIFLNDCKNIKKLICTEKELLCSHLKIINDKAFKEKVESLLSMVNDPNFTGGTDLNYYMNIICLEIWLNIIDKGKDHLLHLSQIGKLRDEYLDVEEVN